ncbi:transposase [Pandoraea sputorum]|uniref:transposase n=1 Tax=Pandoraea sputorum TaxID=93222 RepID=UPI001783CB02
MSIRTLTLSVTCVGRNGKCRYDAESKRRLIEASLQPAVAVAGLALKAGVNANPLRRWVRLNQERGGQVGLSGPRSAPVPTVPSSFIPVVEISDGSAPANVPA